MIQNNDVIESHVESLEGDEGEMTSIMGDEERRLLQRAAREGTASARAAQSEDLKDTARPPSSGAEPKVVIPPEPRPGARRRGFDGLWPLASFLALCAAAWFAARQ